MRNIRYRLLDYAHRFFGFFPFPFRQVSSKSASDCSGCSTLRFFLLDFPLADFRLFLDLSLSGSTHAPGLNSGSESSSGRNVA